jgi:hypothetical protein
VSANPEGDTMPSFNIIVHTNPLTDSQADILVTYLEAQSPVVDGDGTITLTITTRPTQNFALAHAVSLVLMFDFVVIGQVEAMTTADYDEVYSAEPVGL